MAYLIYLVLLLVKLFGSHFAHGQLVVPPVNIGPSYATCLEVKEIVELIRNNISNILVHIIPECGDGLWHRVAYLNMSDPSQQCPSAWRKYDVNGVRACGRPATNSRSCSAILYPTNQQYSRVCGRVIGYQVGTPDSFSNAFLPMVSLEQGYVDGISITYGQPRHHIWSYAAGFNQSRCPCSLQAGSTISLDPPNFIGNDYYCESGNPATTYSLTMFYPSDPLWDGEQCEGTCCSGTGSKSPPWFRVQLPTHTTDGIEVRICADEGTENEDISVKLLEIFVQ